MKYLVCFLLMLMTFPAQAQRFSQADLARSWTVVGSGAGAVDSLGNVINCNFSCTIRIEQNGAISGKTCQVKIAGPHGGSQYAATVTGGAGRYVNSTYAAWTLSFTIAAPSGPITFTSMNRHQFAYQAWQKNGKSVGKAVGPFYHGAGRFQADNGMVGLWHFALNKL